MKSLLIISLSLLLSSRAFTRDMMNPFSEAKLTNSWKYAIAGFTYCKLSIFMFRYFFAIPFANLNKKFYIGCYIHSQKMNSYKIKPLLYQPGKTLRWSCSIEHHCFWESLRLQKAVTDELRGREVTLLIHRIRNMRDPFGHKICERPDPSSTYTRMLKTVQDLLP